MKKNISIIVYFLISQLSYSQQTNVTKLEKDYIFLTNTASFYQATQLISFDSVNTKIVQEKFMPFPNKKVLFRGYDPFLYWYRISLKNTDGTAKNFILLFGGLGIRKAEIWQSINGGNWILTDTTGYKYHFSKRKYAYVHYGIPVTIPPLSTVTYYLNLDESHTYKVATFVLVKAEKMFRYEHRFYLAMGVITGVILLFALTNLYMFFTIRERIHLWYFLYNLTILFFTFKNEGLDNEFLGLDSETGYRASSMAAVAALSITILLHIVQLFLADILQRNILFKLITTVKFIMLTWAFTGWLVFYIEPTNHIEQFVFTTMVCFNLVSVCLILFASIVSYKKGFKPALFILAGLSIFLVGSVSRTLFLEIDSTIFPPSLFEIGLVFEAVIISFGIQHRYNLYKKEKDILTRQLSEQQFLLGKQILNTQENERKRIAEDLHDELGSSLAALRLRLQNSTLQKDELLPLLNVVDKASDDTRNIAHHLMPPEFEKTSLKSLLSNYYTRLNSESPIKFDFLFSGDNGHFNKEEELVIYRIMMELTANVLKHSHADEATVQLICYEKNMEIMLEDNGKGIQKNENSGIGLRNIQSRVNYLHGEMRIDSNEHGTTIIIQIPYKNN